MANPAQEWMRHAHRLRRKINCGKWLDLVAVPIVLAAGGTAGLLLLGKYYAPTESWTLIVAALLPVLAIAWAWWKAKSRFVSEGQALVRLELQHGLHSALSTAYQGVGDWPPVPRCAQDGLRWRWARTGSPLFLALSLVLTAWFLPVTAHQSTTGIIEPRSWQTVEENLEMLVQERVIDEESARDTREAIEELRRRPQKEWYDHSSIEAGDRIQLSHQREISDLKQQMRSAADALRQAAGGKNGKPGDKQMEQSELGEILDNLKAGGLKPNQDLMGQLREMTQGENGQIDPEQLKELLEQLQQNAEMLERMLEQLEGLPEGFGEGNEQGNGEGEDGPGRGAPDRGPGVDPNVFGDAKDLLEAPLRKPLPAADLSQAALGDVLNVGEARHEIDPNDSPTLRSGIGPARAGDGGSAVWSDALLPDEQNALRRYFE